tara:strand:+ start:159 stop:851 length:693 start_codon:yes stop_codon:yes gene_type:complete
MTYPSIIDPLSFYWWTGNILSLLIAIIIIFLGTKIPPDKRRILMIFIGFTLIAAEITQQIYLMRLDIWSLKTSLPIHLCGLSGLLAGMMMLKPNQDGFEFLALIGTPGAIHGLLTPQLNHGEMTLLIIKYYISHTGIIMVPLFIAIVLGYRIRKNAWFRIALACQVLILFIGATNYLINSNYMYLSDRPIVNNPIVVGPWPWYILGFQFAGLIHILVFQYAYRKMRPLPF